MPKRLVLFFHASRNDLEQLAAHRRTPRTSSWGPSSPPLARHQSKMTIFDGIQIVGNGDFAGHTPAGVHLFTGSYLSTASDGKSYGWNTGPSIDQVIARSLQGTRCPPYPSIPARHLFGRHGAGLQDHLRRRGEAARPHSGSESRLQAALHDAVRQHRAARGSRRSASSTPSSPLTPAEDREQRRLQGRRPYRVACVDTDAAQHQDRRVPGPSGISSTDQTIPTVLTEQMDILAAALACDLTRVASPGDHVRRQRRQRLLRGSEMHGQRPPSPVASARHGHERASRAHEDLHVVRRPVRLPSRRSSTRFPRATAHSSTTPSFSGGASSGTGNTHSGSPTPFILAGGSSFGVTGGRYVTYPTMSMPYHQRLLDLARERDGPEQDDDLRQSRQGHRPCSRISSPERAADSYHFGRGAVDSLGAPWTSVSSRAATISLISNGFRTQWSSLAFKVVRKAYRASAEIEHETSSRVILGAGRQSHRERRPRWATDRPARHYVEVARAEDEFGRRAYDHDVGSPRHRGRFEQRGNLLASSSRTRIRLPANTLARRCDEAGMGSIGSTRGHLKRNRAPCHASSCRSSRSPPAAHAPSRARISVPRPHLRPDA